jgi:hypothetical protein
MEREGRKGRKGRKERFGFAGFAGLAFLAVAAAAMAQAPPHVRGENGMQRLVAVYVRARPFTAIDLDGRVALLSVTAAGHRYLVIELACGRSELTQMTTLGHELFHAIEIAEEPSAVNADTVAALYTRIGKKTGESPGLRTFETEAAAAAGLLARRQLLTRPARHGHGT